MKVGFVGLGIMGFPIAERISNGGASIVGFDRSETVRAAAQQAGIQMARSLEECVNGADALCMMLPSVQVATDVVEQVLQLASSGMILVELGTIGRQTAIDHAGQAKAKNCRYVDAPVINGGREGAAKGMLKILAGGEAEVIEILNPLFRHFSTETFHVGSVGTGQAMKLVHNMLLSVITTGTAEALILAQEMGIKPEIAADVLKVSSARSFALEWLFPPALKGDFSGGAKVDILRKDLGLFQEEARRTTAAAEFSARAASLFESCAERGYGQSDVSIVLKLFAEIAENGRLAIKN